MSSLMTRVLHDQHETVKHGNIYLPAYMQEIGPVFRSPVGLIADSGPCASEVACRVGALRGASMPEGLSAANKRYSAITLAL